MTEPILYERDASIAIITLNRPESLNAFNQDMRLKLIEATDRARDDAAVRVVVLTGAGRCFSAGADLKAGFGNGADVERSLNGEYGPSLLNLRDMAKPVIAAVNGFAAGIGLSYALVCDLVVMGENAFLLSPFANIGLIPDGGATWLLARALGYRRAYQMAIECEKLPAADCLSLGLANRLAQDDKVADAARTWAHDLSRRAPLALARSKQLMRGAGRWDYAQAIGEEAALQHLCIDSADCREGIEAFLEKRKPEFNGD
ncbi:MAG: enoyl-CoA hydratase/isomerase family protein [Gammaproteobacteria bacterium]|nr:enoyl-CoA hydratase/isomerase family protein [Gammaproteobacteria bacterium]